MSCNSKVLKRASNPLEQGKKNRDISLEETSAIDLVAQFS